MSTNPYDELIKAGHDLEDVIRLAISDLEEIDRLLSMPWYKRLWHYLWHRT